MTACGVQQKPIFLHGLSRMYMCLNLFVRAVVAVQWWGGWGVLGGMDRVWRATVPVGAEAHAALPLPWEVSPWLAVVLGGEAV
eukprot:3685253-Amphidinium_carterae.1